MKQSKKKQNQVSTGVLKNNEYGTQYQDYSDVAVNEIQAVAGISDYRKETTSSHPFVVKASNTFYCIDGWEFIEAARASGQDKIRCHIDEVDDINDLELAIRKVANRTMPRGGTASYAEKVRNIGELFALLETSTDNPVIYSHGGARSGISYTNNMGDNVRVLIAERLGKSKTTVNSYINYRAYLTPQAMQSLVEDNANKDFFEKVAKNKRTKVRELEHVRTESAAIKQQISSAILDWFKEYSDNGSITSTLQNDTNNTGNTSVNTNSGNAQTIEPDDADNTNTSEIASPPNQISSLNPAPLATEEHLKIEIESLINRLQSYIGDGEPLVSHLKGLSVEANKLMNITASVARLSAAEGAK